MKVVEICQTPMLSCEVYEILKTDPKNELGFSSTDPLDNPNISDPDQLRRLVSARRICGYLENTLHVGKIVGGTSTASRIASRLHSEFQLSLDIISRLIDSFIILQNSKVYTYAILRDLISNGSLQMEQVDAIHNVLLELMVAEPVDEPALKRKSRSLR